MPAINILGISSSPQKLGSSDILLNEALKGAKRGGASVSKIFLNDLSIKPCQACGGCDKDGVCVVDDDMTAIYKKVSKADAVIIATPIYFGTVSAQLKAMIDRYQAHWVKKYILKKDTDAKKKRKGIFLCVAGSRRKDFFYAAMKVVRNFFATEDIKYTCGIFCGGVNGAEGILKRKSVIKKAYDMGHRLAGTKKR